MGVRQAATTRGAQVCGIDDITGTIEPSKRADLITIIGDPLADIAAITHVRFVIQQGLLFETDCRTVGRPGRR